jgi:hypothetical protein
MRPLPCLFLLAGALSALASDKAALIRPLRYTGMADASGAVPVSSNLFLVADDESNALRLYRANQGGPPLKEFNFNAFLEVRGKSIEADLEAAARVGDRAFWIGSHGRNKNGKERDNRCRLFATDIHVAGDEVTVVPVGRPYKRLLDDLFGDPRFARFHLAEASRHAPKEAEALNIEGLSATPEGHLLIGFRNPLPEGKALLIPLLNPNEVIDASPGRFGPAIQLDLGGLGIRDMVLFQDTYVIIGGPYHGGGPFYLYRWAGQGTSPERIKTEDFGTLHPEVVIIYPEMGLREFQLLSDDGTRSTDGILNRELPMSRRSFRSIWVRP